MLPATPYALEWERVRSQKEWPAGGVKHCYPTQYVSFPLGTRSGGGTLSNYIQILLQRHTEQLYTYTTTSFAFDQIVYRICIHTTTF